MEFILTLTFKLKSLEDFKDKLESAPFEMIIPLELVSYIQSYIDLERNSGCTCKKCYVNRHFLVQMKLNH